MKWAIGVCIALLIATAGAWFVSNDMPASGDSGHVLLGFGGWSIQMSLVSFLLALAVCFFIFYVALRMLFGLLRMPETLRRKGAEKKSARSQQALIGGLIDSAEGNWERAERRLIKHASNSAAPLVHYLTAAKAAQSRGAYEKRDRYLKMARESSPDAELTVGLTQAELHLSDKQFENALESLTRLESLAPTHATVLKLLRQTYQHLEDWDGIRKLIPSLHKNRVLMEAEIKLLETETYSGLLKKAAQNRDSDALEAVWQDVPKHIQNFQGVHAVYFAAMIDAGSGAAIEESLAERLTKEWSDTLLVLYGSIISNNPQNQLKQAERWLKKHPRDAVLQRILGKISLRCGEADKADKYLTNSIGIEPSVETYQLLGDLLNERGDKDRSSECYRRGLELASNELINNIEALPSSPKETASNGQAPSPVLANSVG